jgi:hypothetical protein
VAVCAVLRGRPVGRCPRSPRRGGLVPPATPAEQGRTLTSCGGFGERETPLPIPNRAVKPLSADGTCPERDRESRTPPLYRVTRAAPRGGPSSFSAPTPRTAHRAPRAAHPRTRAPRTRAPRTRAARPRAPAPPRARPPGPRPSHLPRLRGRADHGDAVLRWPARSAPACHPREGPEPPRRLRRSARGALGRSAQNCSQDRCARATRSAPLRLALGSRRAGARGRWRGAAAARAR